MNKTFFLIACLSAALAVTLGAMGAHMLQQWLPAEKIHTFEIGVRYQFYHAMALLAVALVSPFLNKKLANASGWLFVLGTVFFSGSLYLLATSNLLEINSLRPVLGPMTPLGGVFFILGWLVLFSAGVVSKADNKQ